MTHKNDNNVMVAVLSYLVIGLIWYAIDDSVRNNFTKYHVKQGIVLLITGVIIGAINRVLWVVPIMGRLIMIILQIAFLILLIIGIINAASNKKKKLPGIGVYAKLLNF